MNCITDNRHFGAWNSDATFEPRWEKNRSWGFRPGPTQTGLYSHRTWLEA